MVKASTTECTVNGGNLNSIKYEKILHKLLDEKFHLFFLLGMTVKFQVQSSMRICVCD